MTAEIIVMLVLLAMRVALPVTVLVGLGTLLSHWDARRDIA